MVNMGKHSHHKTCACSTARDVANHAVKTSGTGEVGTLEYRLSFKNTESKAISPWHSIPLYAGQGLLNFVCEIPRNSRAKFEVATDEPSNPIKQDSKKGKPRSYAVDILWNYGMLPQTWEDPHHESEDCDGHIGDNDPVDVVEIGDKTALSGEIYAVKPVAAFAMIDEGELDWKVVAISANDPRSKLVHDVDDMEEHFPGTLDAIREWFRTYKTLEGKPLNKFALNERAMGREYTLGVVAQTHSFWKSLVAQSRVDPTSTKLVVGDVPVPTRCFIPPKVDEKPTAGNMKDALEAVVDLHLSHKRHQEESEVTTAETDLEHDSKRVELVTVTVA